MGCPHAEDPNAETGTGADEGRVAGLAASTDLAAHPRSLRRTDEGRTPLSWPRLISALLAVTVTAGITRVASSRPELSAAAIAVLTLVVLVVGWRNVRAQPARLWRWGWLCYGLALALLAVAVWLSVQNGHRPASLMGEGIGLVASGAVLVGTAVLIRHRTSGRALSLLLEALVAFVVVGYVVWTLTAVPAPALPWPALPVAGVALDVACLWMAMRLVTMASDQPVALSFLLATLACRVVVDGLSLSRYLGGGPVTGDRLAALSLWTFCLAAATAIHPTLRRPLDLTVVRERNNLPTVTIALIGCVLVVPAAVALRWAIGIPTDLWFVLVGATVLPSAVVIHLSHQLFARTRAEYRAQHDPLTGLANRNLFEDQLSVAINQSNRNGGRFALMFLDLDRFKTINDSLGHAAGNQLLQLAAARLRSCVRENDTVARIGGDEFTLLVMDLDGQRDCAAVAQKVLDAFTEPFTAGGREVFSSTSIGIAVYPENGSDIESLLKHADTAMYRAKARGRGSYEFYTSDMSARASVKLSLENSLHAAIEREDLFLQYQPQVRLRDGKLVRLEALARWQHPQLGYISPYAFIPLAEESGLIHPLGEWALTAACRQLREWLDDGRNPVPVAVNVSARQLSNRPVDALVEQLLAVTGVPGHLLEIELTESVLLEDRTRVNRVLGRLRELGVRASIDDFGTGYSGLSYLAQMPIDSLKIDRSFVEQLGSLVGDHGVVTAIIGLAHSLGLEVIAEGVETTQQARLLEAQGCDLMQGYLISPPLPARRVPALLETGQVFRWEDGAPCAQGDPDKPLLLGPPAQFDGDVAQLLERICRSEEGERLDPAVLAEVLAALAPPRSAQSNPARAISARIAIGTFAGLIPLSGGLAAAGALPEGVQQVYSTVFDHLGITAPAAAAPAASPGRPPASSPQPGGRTTIPDAVGSQPAASLAPSALPAAAGKAGPRKPAVQSAPPTPGPTTVSTQPGGQGRGHRPGTGHPGPGSGQPNHTPGPKTHGKANSRALPGPGRRIRHP